MKVKSLFIIVMTGIVVTNVLAKDVTTSDLMNLFKSRIDASSTLTYAINKSLDGRCKIFRQINIAICPQYLDE
jgi:hypothetical protein